LFIDAVTLPSRAILLDVDGTILDLAPTPLEVVVPPDLTVCLELLSKRVGGALAFVSGPPLAELDLFFAPLKLPSIAVHGAELRLGDGTVHRATTFLDPQLKTELTAIADDRPGVVIEDKGYSIAIHYRLAPQLGQQVRDEVTAVCARFSSARLEILPGKSVVEVKQQASPKVIHINEPVRAQAIRSSAAATRKPLSASSLLTCAKNGSSPVAWPVRGSIILSRGAMRAGSLNPIRALPSSIRRRIRQ